MPVTVTKFNRTKEFILSGSVRLLYDDLYMALIKPGLYFTNDLISFNQIQALEIDPTLYYQAGGNLVLGVGSRTNSEGKAEITIGDIEYSNVTANVRYAVLYSNITAFGVQKPMIALCDFGSDLSFVNTVFQFTWPEPLMRW